MNISLEVDLFTSDALTSAHKVHVHVVFQLHVHVHHSLSCVPLRQYRACVVDSLGLGITCLISLYYVYKTSQSCLLCFLCHPYISHSNLKNFYIYLYNTGSPHANPLIIIVGIAKVGVANLVSLCGSVKWGDLTPGQNFSIKDIVLQLLLVFAASFGTSKIWKLSSNRSCRREFSQLPSCTCYWLCSQAGHWATTNSTRSSNTQLGDEFGTKKPMSSVRTISSVNNRRLTCSRDEYDRRIAVLQCNAEYIRAVGEEIGKTTCDSFHYELRQHPFYDCGTNHNRTFCAEFTETVTGTIFRRF